MKPTPHRCERARHHRWGERKHETATSVVLRCSLCGREFTVEKNPPRWAEIHGGER